MNYPLFMKAFRTKNIVCTVSIVSICVTNGICHVLVLSLTEWLTSLLNVNNDL